MANVQKVRYPAALALGALALGAFAVGALAIGYLAIGRLVVKRARIGRLQVDELVIRRIQRPEQTPLSSPASTSDSECEGRGHRQLPIAGC
jgi:hypothetical protein